MHLRKMMPLAGRKTLILLAGTMWVCVGLMLISMSYKWLSVLSSEQMVMFFSAGFVLAMPVHHMGFTKIVNKNLNRLLPINGKKCLFSFITWKSYLIIVIMMSMGLALRHSSLPKQYLSIIYTCIGLALFLSGTRYFTTLAGMSIKKDR
jgi:hypothetical protein